MQVRELVLHCGLGPALVRPTEKAPLMVQARALGPGPVRVQVTALHWGSVREPVQARGRVLVWELLLPCLLFLRSLALFCCLAAQPGDVELRKLHHL